MKEMKRAIHFDFHTPAGIYDFNNDFDFEQFAEDMKNANVGYVNVFARCNKGYSYYPTKIGTPYPTLTTDLTGNMIKALKKRNIGVTAYLNGGLNHKCTIENPCFMRITKDGKCYDDPDNNIAFFRVPCFNTGYREYLISEIKEILELYDPDGIFVDCMLVRSCYCPSCMKKMKALGVDHRDNDAVYAFAVDTMRETMAQLSAVIPEGKRFIINGCPPYEDTHHLQSHVELECLPTSAAWGYDFIAAMAPYHRNFAKDHVYMTGSFVRGWGEFGSKKTISALENDVYDALMYGFTPSIGDHIHPRDGINREFYKKIGKLYARVKELEKWNDDTTPVCNVAIIEDLVPLVAGGEISVMGEFKEVCTLPEMEKVQSTIKDGRTQITLPQINGYKSFLLKN